MTLSGQAGAPTFVRLAAHPVRWRLLAELAGSDLRVRELVALVDEPQNQVSYHLRLLREGGLVTARRSSFDARDTYYHLDPERCSRALAATGAALHVAPHAPPPADPPKPADPPPTGRPALSSESAGVPPVAVLVTCTGNSARSPIAEALLRRYTAGRVAATSAGSQPRPRLHPHAVRVLRERYGIDVSAQRPRHLGTLTGHRFDYVISLCDKVREVAPAFPGNPRRIHWSIPDPAADRRGYRQFLDTANEIDTRIRYLIPTIAAPSKEVHR